VSPIDDALQSLYQWRTEHPVAHHSAILPNPESTTEIAPRLEQEWKL
jgi:hypothetical protein